MAIPTFGNSPRFQQKPVTIEGLLTMTNLNQAIGAISWTGNAANALGTNKNDLQGLTFQKNIAHELINLKGENIDMNFMFDLFKTNENYVDTKRFYNRYAGEVNFNVYFASTTTGTGTATGQLIAGNHNDGGALSMPSTGYRLLDKETHTMYEVTVKDDSIPNAHKITVRSLSSSTTPVTLYANRPYLVLQAVGVGGYSCAIPKEDFQTLGWARENYFLRARRDSKIQIDTLRGFLDTARFAVYLDAEGKEFDAFDTYQMQQLRKDLRYFMNVHCFDGMPDFNQTYINTGGLAGQGLDSWTIGFYGLNPSLRYGGASLIPFSASVGFDWETDWEPFMLYNDGFKRTKEFTAMGGLGFNLKTVDRTNKLVARNVVGTLAFDAFKRSAMERGEKDMESAVSKIGLSAYSYKGRTVTLKELGALSDERSIGSDTNRYTSYFMPHGGLTDGNGKELTAVEFNQIKKNNWGGDYTEHYRDLRNMPNGCEAIEMDCEESLNMIVHNPEFWAIAEGYQNN